MKNIYKKDIHLMNNISFFVVTIDIIIRRVLAHVTILTQPLLMDSLQQNVNFLQYLTDLNSEFF